MNHKSLIFRYLATLIAIPAVGCSTAPMSNQNAKTTGAVAGGLAGATLGGVIGHQSGRTGEGALAGGVIGTFLGAEHGGKVLGGDQSIQRVERE